MGWSNMPTWLPDQVVGATDFNTFITDNMNYLWKRPANVVMRDNNAHYSTNSTSFVNVDGTNLSITLPVTSGKVLVCFTGVVGANAVAHPVIHFDFTIDGTRYGAAGSEGIAGASIDTYFYQRTVSFVALVTGLSAGNHTFTLQWKATNEPNACLFAGGGVSSPGGVAADYLPLFSVQEIG